MWPSYDMCEKLMSRLKEHGYKSSYQHLSYEYSGHDVAFVPGVWQQILNFLDNN